MSASDLPELRLKRNEDRRIRAGHQWVFSNEVDTAATPLNAFAPGAAARLSASDGRPLGLVYVNPASLIVARVLSRKPSDRIGPRLLRRRLDAALELRRALGWSGSGRLVFGEADRLPGLVLDRYGDVLVGQISTAGMERQRGTLAELLRERLDAGALLWRNDSALRELEGLPREVVAAFGEIPERLVVDEDGLAFTVHTRESQKTGWFYDQRSNRARMARYAPGRRVLDLFCYAGAWGIRAARAGAAAVTCVDSGARAMVDLEVNVREHDLLDHIRMVRADAFAFLEEALADGEEYDLVILDPPAFAKRRRDAAAALKAYRRLNELGLRLLSRNGILVTCSCSFHVREDAFLDAVRQAGRHVDRQLQRLERLGQAPDHPVHPAIPETDYLKGGIFRACPN